jgi:hypothetical protein
MMERLRPRRQSSCVLAEDRPQTHAAHEGG